jgi:hypothetical protein
VTSSLYPIVVTLHVDIFSAMVAMGRSQEYHGKPRSRPKPSQKMAEITQRNAEEMKLKKGG